MADPLVVPPVVFKEPIIKDVVVPVKNPPAITPEEDPALNDGVLVSGGGSTIRTSSGIVRLNADGTVINDVPTVETESGVENGVPSFTFTAPNPNAGLSGQKQETRSQGELQNTYLAKGDWRVRLSLATGADYLYNDPVHAGILAPLRDTGGVIFPYTPNITIAYNASYEPTNITHSNYKIFQYQSSGIESVQIAADFTAQDASEATYLLAVIHFLRTVTKMFYGQDQNPKAGTPPPLCFLHGLGAFQFDNHPLVISVFTYQLPDEVDYIRAGTVVPVQPGQSTAPQQPKDSKEPNALQKIGRLIQNLSQFKIGLGGELQPPDFIQPGSYKVQEPTYVPTRIKIQLTALPVVSRNDISNTFSLQQYGSGSLMRGSLRRGGGIW